MTLENQTAVDPKSALTGASQLGSIGDRMLSKWYTLRARIEHLNASAPWGKDDVGKQFNKNYLEGGEHAPAINVLDAGEHLVTAVARLGPQVTEGVQGTVDVDDLTAQWFGKH